MRYFICLFDGSLSEVSEIAYDFWYDTNEERFELPEYVKDMGELFYTVSVSYYGICESDVDGEDEDEDFKPFTLEFYEHELYHNHEGVDYRMTKDMTEFFLTWGELLKRRDEIIEMLEKKTDCST